MDGSTIPRVSGFRGFTGFKGFTGSGVQWFRGSRVQRSNIAGPMRAWFPLAVALLAHPAPQVAITLEVRTFNGTVDVSDVTRVVIHRAGQREQPVAQINVGTPRTV